MGEKCERGWVNSVIGGVRSVVMGARMGKECEGERRVRCEEWERMGEQCEKCFYGVRMGEECAEG